jgi:GNAT superfamily N-acetyltransferase
MEIKNLIINGIIDLKFHQTTPEHAKEYGLKSETPIYIETLFVQKNSRLKGIGKRVLIYLENYAKDNGNDCIFGHINNNSEFTKDDRQTFFTDVNMIKYWLNNKGYAVNEDNNDFYKTI